MDKFNLIKNAFTRQPVDRQPYSLWKHFPEHDKTPEGLANAQAAFQEKLDSDIMKISIHGSAFVVDFGAELGGYNPVSGSRLCTKPPVSSTDDWETLEPIDVNDGEFGKQVKAMALISEKFQGKVPTMMTVFSPFMVANKMDPNILEHFKTNPGVIKEQVTMLTRVMTEYTRATVDAGANGIFLATQHFNDRLDDAVRHDLEFEPMKHLIEKSVRDETFLVLHLHGDAPDFNLASSLPRLSAINWHDQQTKPDLIGAKKLFPGGLLGGLDSESWKEKQDVIQFRNEISSTVKDFGGSGLILAPGCVIPQYVDELWLEQVVNVINGL